MDMTKTSVCENQLLSLDLPENPEGGWLER